MLKLCALTLAILLPSSALAAGSPEGHWARGDGKAKVVVEPCGDDLCAINTWIRPDVKDEKVGDRLVMTVSGGDGAWTGSAYDPQRRLTLKFSLTVDGDSMTTKGCVLGGLWCKSMDWKRLDGG